MIRRILFTVAVIFTVIPCSHAQQPAGPAQTISPLVTDGAIGVLRVDLSKLDIQKQFKFLRQEMGDISALRELEASLQKVVAPLKKLGATEFYTVFYVSQRPREGFIFAVPETKQLAADKVRAFFRDTARAPQVATFRGLIAAGGDNLLDIAKAPAGNDPQMAAAFKSVAGYDVQFVARLSGMVRKVISQEAPPQLPPELGSAKTDDLVKAFRWGAAGLKLGPKMSLRAQVQATDATAAKRLHAFANNFMTYAEKQNNPGLLLLPKLIRAAGVKTVKDQVRVAVEPNQVAALLKKMAKPLQEGQNRIITINNLKQIALSLHSHNDAYKKLPAMASFDKNGKPLLSWRVHILPFIEQDQLYRQFKLNEPWDSPHNKKLIAKMPPTFRSAYSKAKPGMTTYLAPIGKGTIFGKRPTTLSKITARDGASNTVWLVDADDSQAVIWTKPADLKVDAKNPHRGLRINDRKAFVAGFADGSVREIPARISAEMLNRLFDNQDGKVVEIPR